MKKISSLLALGASLSILAACTPTPPVTSTNPPPTPMSSSSSSSSSAKGWSWDGSTLATGKHIVTLKTNKGDIKLEIDADAAPKTATNFLALASTGYYSGLTFHRVIPGFMIQGGDPDGTGRGGKSIFGEIFEDEIDANPLFKNGYKAGVIAMANRGPDTNGSQFFIMDADYPLQPNYTIFGHVISGQDVVHTIAGVPRDSADMPEEAVTFSATIEK